MVKSWSHLVFLFDETSLTFMDRCHLVLINKTHNAIMSAMMKVLGKSDAFNIKALSLEYYYWHRTSPHYNTNFSIIYNVLVMCFMVLTENKLK